VLCSRFIVSAVLALGSPASTPADAVGGATGEPAGTPPPGTGAAAQPPGSPAPSSPPSHWSDGVAAPLDTLRGTASASGPGSLPIDGADPLGSGSARVDRGGPSTIVTPLGHRSSPTEERRAPRRIELVRIEVLVGPVWRVRTGELMALAGLEFGRLRGFSGAVQGGIIVAPDREIVAVSDFPIGAGFVYRHRFGRSSLYGSAGLTAGLLVHRAATDRGLVHRVDPDFQVPLRLAWTVGEVGFSFALLQGFSTRVRTYVRRGTEVWHRIPYRIGFAVGIHFDVGVGRSRSRRSDRASRGLP
jgi:hypothetical protein